jgi:APA family basic amino acid/polyamine antiporter
MGELPAVLVAACLSLEYGISASAVARSWGDKVVEWLKSDVHIDNLSYIDGNYFNPLAAVIATASVVLLMFGVKESKSVTNFFTMTKILVVVFMTVVGLILMKPKENLHPFIPPQFGLVGVFRGATSSFFGYIGFDEVCCVAGEAINPQKNMPLAIIINLGIVTTLYIIAALALTGMQQYDEINPVSGFPVAFESRGWLWASQISAFGEIFTLPIGK